MVAEAFIASFGILGIGGVVAFVIGSVMLFDTDAPAFQLSLELIGGFAIASVLLLLGVIGMLVRSRRQPVVSGPGMVGSQGEALYAFSGHGQVRVAGEIWSAYSDRPVADKQRVRVLAREGLRLRVEPVPPAQADHPGEV
jgi:membrane-bound serine protease (ClpP class)